jgi:lysine 2,3-aminomutase
MTTEKTIFYQPRNYNSIPIWKDVTPDEWNDAGWQKKNSIHTVEQLEKVIKINTFQKSEIERTLKTLISEGKEPMRITPYYASLMSEDPFHPTMLVGEKERLRLDPIFWQSVPTPANLFFHDTGKEGAMSRRLPQLRSGLPAISEQGCPFCGKKHQLCIVLRSLSAGKITRWYS